jgi:malonate decarboxylase epsilon subunit
MVFIDPQGAPMSFAVMFPGQGAQTVGFLHDLPDMPAVKAVLSEASDLLGRDVLELDTEAELGSTGSTQVALVVAGAAFAEFCATEEVKPTAVTGMSVGAYAAAIAAGIVSLQTALTLVQHRARLMEEAFPLRSHGMLAIGGLRLQRVKGLLDGTSAVIANYNTASQFVVAGKMEELEILRERALEEGAELAKVLAMPVASHLPALLPAAEELMRVAADLPFAMPNVPIYSGRTGRALSTSQSVREELAWNMAYPVLWNDTVGAIGSLGIDLLVEAPPGTTLKRLAAQILPETAAIAAGEMRWDVLLREARRHTGR